jgi:hypothetical protein
MRKNSKQNEASFRLSSPLRLGILFLLLAGLIGFTPHIDAAQAQPLSTPNPNPPATTVKLIFIHHSTGDNWLRDDYGKLGLALSQNNYFVSDTNYGWGPNSIGDRTDIPNWTEWFTSASTPTYMAALFTEYGQHSSYTRTLTDPGGENQIIMFKSCFPNSALEGNPKDPPNQNGGLTVGHAKWVYNQILTYFGAHPEKLFIVITAPPLIDGTYAANARAFNQWLMNNWLSSNNYTQTNVAVFDFYNVLTGPNNHHRFINGAEQHVFTPGMNTEYYPSGDDHPNQAGSKKATNEYIGLLNVFYHRWNPSAPTCYSLGKASIPAAGGTINVNTAPNCGAASYSNGTSVAITASPNYGYVFANWSGDASGTSASTSVTMNGSKAVTANFGSAAVTPPNGTTLHSNRPTFDWANYPGAAGYQIQISKNTGFTQLVIDATLSGAASSTYTPPSNLPANSKLYWRYRAKLTTSTFSTWSPTITLLTAALPPTAPQLVSPANNALITGLSPLFDWTNSTIPAGTTFDHYQIQIATNSTFASIVHNVNITGLANSQDNSAVLTSGLTYYWRVRAWNATGNYSAWSAVWIVRIK